MSLRSSLVLLCAAALFSTCLTVNAQDSTATSQMSESLWTMLLQTTNDLPAQIDSLTDSFNTQIASLQANNADLTSSNSTLKASNDSLKLENADLTNSLKVSQAALAISEEQRKQLEKDLQDSTQSTIQAQKSAKALEAENGLLRVLGVVLGISTALTGGYVVGHLALNWW